MPGSTASGTLAATTAALTAPLIASPRHATLDRHLRQEYRPPMNDDWLQTMLFIIC
jgi:hypothetical protein